MMTMKMLKVVLEMVLVVMALRRRPRAARSAH
jgi:hypothetical protein